MLLPPKGGVSKHLNTAQEARLEAAPRLSVPCGSALTLFPQQSPWLVSLTSTVEKASTVSAGRAVGVVQWGDRQRSGAELR